MPEPGFILLYVASPERSAAFYAALLDRAPVEQSPTFAMFALPSGLRLGLWSRDTVAPPPSGTPGAGEIAFIAADVPATHADWVARGIGIAQPPTEMDFGLTFVGVDPDGHRLRVLSAST